MENKMENKKDMNLEGLAAVSGGISKKEKKRRQRLKKFRQKNPPVIREWKEWKFESNEPEPAKPVEFDGPTSVSEYVEANKEAFVFNFPKMDITL